MGALRRIARSVWGDDVDPALRPVLAVNLAASMAGSTLWSFMAIWAIEVLHAKAQLPFALALGAVLSGAAGYGGGWLSDRVGRRRMILAASGAGACYPLLLLLAVQDRLWVGLGFLALAGAVGGLGGSVSQAMVADLVPPERHAPAYAATRVASNFGVVVGPPLGGALILLTGWTGLFLVVAVLEVLAFGLAVRLLPRRGAYAPEHGPRRGSFSTIVRDGAFLFFLGSAIFAWIIYVAYEIVLPVALVDGYGYAVATWGFLVWINPLLVTLFQVRLTKRLAGHAEAPVLVAAMLLMGLPFALLTLTHALVAVVVVLVVFVVGEMLWVPTSQAIVARLAPEDIRGAYMGAFGSAPAIGFALSPLIGLQVRNSFGDTATWTLYAAIGIVAAVLAVSALAVVARRAGGATREA